MAIQLRSRSTSKNQHARDLLESLIEAPPTPASARTHVALRSTTEARRHALSGFQLRTWVDTLLQHAERLVLLAALVVFGSWFADGPLRDWLHEQQAASSSPAAVVAAAAPVAQPVHAKQRRTQAVPLPYITPAMSASPPADDFFAPRQSAVNAPVAVAPQPTHLVVPALGLDTLVKEVFIVDGAWQVADYAAGYLHDTGLPGAVGNTVLAGHAGLRGGVFRDLGSLAANDDIYLDAGGWRYHYRVRDSKSVWPEQVEVLNPTATPVLTLMTCTNWDTQRLVVVADLLDSKPTPSP